MARLYRDGQTANVAAVDRREGPPYRDHFGFVRVREFELLEAFLRRTASAVARSSPSAAWCRRRSVSRLVLLESVQVAQQQQRRRPGVGSQNVSAYQERVAA
jgi:hypothetical protein